MNLPISLYEGLELTLAVGIHLYFSFSRLSLTSVARTTLIWASMSVFLIILMRLDYVLSLELARLQFRATIRDLWFE